MQKPYAFIGNYYHKHNAILYCKNNTYVSDNIGINNHKTQRNPILNTISNMDVLPLNTSNIPIIESIRNSLAQNHHAINRELQNIAFGLFFLIFIRKRWHR
jgi:hypothetical protein